MIKRFLAALSVALLLASCASEAPALITETMTDEFFRNWVRKNAPNATEFKNGVFMEYIHKSNTTDTTTIKPRKSWVYFSYTAQTLENSIFATRDSTNARRVGIWNRSTHFIDDYQVLGTTESYTKICIGAQYGMIQMKTGDHARIYVPATAAYYDNSMNINSGYLTTDVLYQKRPIIFDIRINKIVDDPLKFERDSVERWAKKNWNIEIKDTIFDGMYLKKTKTVETGEEILKDQPVTIDWTEYYTDFFIMNTNVDSIAKRYNIYNSSNTSQYTATKFNAGVANSDIDLAMVKAVLKMKRGERADILCLSKWTKNGNEGNLSNIPQIEYYQPRIFRIRVYTQEEENEQKK